MVGFQGRSGDGRCLRIVLFIVCPVSRCVAARWDVVSLVLFCFFT